MQKLKKQMYITKKNGPKVNCYYVNISKEILAKTNITENDNLKITAKNNKIIVEKEKDN